VCGIVGVVAPRGRFTRAQLDGAVARLRARGPDASGVARFDLPGGRELWLGHARLSVLELSEAGAQPMVRHDHSGRAGVEAGVRGAIVFNGEVYDHAAHREGLPGLRTRSDTEVLLEGVLTHGAGFVARLDAMLAAAVYDARSNTLVLARDRMGKKPLFLHEGEGSLAFASQPGAFAALGLPLDVDPLARAYTRWLGHVPGPLCIWKRCRTFPAGSTATVDLAGGLQVRAEAFWDPLAGYASPYVGTEADARAELSALLDDSVRLRLQADVPVGVFLSGGVDSSLVAASVARQGGAARAFVVKPRDPRHDESERAMRTARTLGLDVTVLDVGPDDHARQLPRVVEAFDQPHATLSQVALMALSERARESVRVVLTGDGGDETFLGYPWIAHPGRIARIWRGLRALRGTRAPDLARTAVGRRVLAAGCRVAGLNADNLNAKLHVFGLGRDARVPADIHDGFMELRPRASLAREDRELLGEGSLLDRARAWYPGYDWDAAARTDMELLGALDTVLYLRDDVLQKVDRATMAHGVEARSPLLDHRIVTLGTRLPLRFKVRGGTFKAILRDLVAERVDPQLATLPKRGFGVQTPEVAVGEGTEAQRWARWVEAAWEARWTPGGGADAS
jgi:asparagine synthase (glutamine-hydrolysing)